MNDYLPHNVSLTPIQASHLFFTGDDQLYVGLDCGTVLKLTVFKEIIDKIVNNEISFSGGQEGGNPANIILRLDSLTQVANCFIKDVYNGWLVDGADQLWSARDGSLKRLLQDKRHENIEILSIIDVGNESQIGLLTTEGDKFQLLLVSLLASTQNKKSLDFGANHKIHLVRLIEELNLIVACCQELDDNGETSASGRSCVMLLHARSGEQIGDPRYFEHGLLPMHIAYVANHKALIVACNSLSGASPSINTMDPFTAGERTIQSCLSVFSLLNEDSMMGSLSDDGALIRHIENEKGCIMDVKEYTWFDGTSHIVVALANQVQVFQFTPDVASDCMRLLHSIDGQINVFKVNVKKIDEPDMPGYPPLKEIEYQVADIMKSVTVYSLKRV